MTILAEALGEQITTARLRIYVEMLSDISQPGLAEGFRRAHRELRFFPKIAELRQLAGECRAESEDAEARAAWDQVNQFVGKYVGSDPWGNYGPEHGWYRPFPKLPDRILACVRRCGGWRTFACMTNEDFPFVQKRFFEEFKAWSAVESIAAQSRMLESHDQPTLRELPLASPGGEKRKSDETIVAVKGIREPLTEEQASHRRATLQRQAQKLRERAS